jgi:predicted molibdopterin-dependent oxidoreductase YjgC
MKELRVVKHPILGRMEEKRSVTIYLDGKPVQAYEGEMVASALAAEGIRTFRHTRKSGEPRGIFCGIGQCSDCIMQIDGIPNVRSCITEVREGMQVRTIDGDGSWDLDKDEP